MAMENSPFVDDFPDPPFQPPFIGDFLLPCFMIGGYIHIPEKYRWPMESQLAFIDQSAPSLKLGFVKMNVYNEYALRYSNMYVQAGLVDINQADLMPGFVLKDFFCSSYLKICARP